MDIYLRVGFAYGPITSLSVGGGSMPHTDDPIPRGFRPANDNQEQQEGGIQTKPTTSSTKERKKETYTQTLPSFQTNKEPGIQTDPTISLSKQRPGIQTEPVISSNKQRTRYPHIVEPIISSNKQ